jgi:hypothetical protein
MKKSLLGSMGPRIKTDLRLPPAFLEKVDEVCVALGVPKNAFFVLAASMLALQLAPMVRGKSRKQLILAMQDSFQKILSEVVKTL